MDKIRKTWKDLPVWKWAVPAVAVIGVIILILGLTLGATQARTYGFNMDAPAAVWDESMAESLTGNGYNGESLPPSTDGPNQKPVVFVTSPDFACTIQFSYQQSTVEGSSNTARTESLMELFSEEEAEQLDPVSITSPDGDTMEFAQYRYAVQNQAGMDQGLDTSVLPTPAPIDGVPVGEDGLPVYDLDLVDSYALMLVRPLYTEDDVTYFMTASYTCFSGDPDEEVWNTALSSASFYPEAPAQG